MGFLTPTHFYRAVIRCGLEKCHSERKTFRKEEDFVIFEFMSVEFEGQQVGHVSSKTPSKFRSRRGSHLGKVLRSKPSDFFVLDIFHLLSRSTLSTSLPTSVVPGG